MSQSSQNNTLQVPGTHKTDMPPPSLPNAASSSSTPAVILPLVTEPPKIDFDSTKKEKTMAEFLAMMDNYAPIVSLFSSVGRQ